MGSSGVVLPWLAFPSGLAPWRACLGSPGMPGQPGCLEWSTWPVLPRPGVGLRLGPAFPPGAGGGAGGGPFSLETGASLRLPGSWQGISPAVPDPQRYLLPPPRRRFLQGPHSAAASAPPRFHLGQSQPRFRPRSIGMGLASPKGKADRHPPGSCTILVTLFRII